MDKTTFRILDILSRDLGSQTSINELTRRIKETHGTAYYKNIYDKIQDLKKQDILNLTEIGKASVITLNFNDYQLTDLLAEMELKKKQELLEKNIEMQMIFLEMDKEFRSIPSIESILIIDPEKNFKLNRMEFLFLLANFDETTNIYSIMEGLQSKHNIKIDSLIITEKEFLNLLDSEGSNPLKAMLSNKIAFFSPQDFWIWIKTALIKGIRIKTEETNPAGISEQDLTYNLNRFGYKEFGLKIEQGRKICIEYIITSILLQDDARRVQAVPILLTKNKIDYNLLIFLCKKYKKAEELLGLIKALTRIKESKETNNAIRILETMKIKGIRMNEKNIAEKMRLYDAVR
jgi:hypothetical protein